MSPLPGVPRPARDFAAEEAWLKRLPLGPDTDRRQDEWEADPAVRLWRANEDLRKTERRVSESLKTAIADLAGGGPEEDREP